MRTCILHTGLHKTGTSALQTFLDRNRGLLLDHGFLYPLAGRHLGAVASAQHQALVRAIAADPGNPFGDRPLHEFDAEIRATPHETLILSAEVIGRDLFARGDFRLLDHLRARGYRLVAVTTIRPQHEVIGSRYTQRIKTFQETRGFDAFFADVLDTPLAQFHKMPGILAGTGVEAHFLAYDRVLRRAGIEGAFTDLLFALDGRLGAEARRNLARRLAARRAGRRNEGIGPVELALCRTISREINAAGPLPIALTAPLQGIVRRAMAWSLIRDRDACRLMDAARLAQVAACHDAGNEAFARAVWGRGWAEVYGPVPDPGEPNDPEIRPSPAIERQVARILPRARRAVLARLEREKARVARDPTPR